MGDGQAQGQARCVALPTGADGRELEPGSRVVVAGASRGLFGRRRADVIQALTWLGDGLGWVVELDRHGGMPQAEAATAIRHAEDGPQAARRP